MPPAPSHIEAPPSKDEPRPKSAGSTGTDRPPSTRPSTSPVRMDTASSIATTEATTIAATDVHNETSCAPSASASPTFSTQTVFPAREGADVTTGRSRPSRRRTGPLSASQREKAAIIRKLGACNDCRRRRVACHPNHHNMSWEEAKRKYKNHIPPQEYATLAGRPPHNSTHVAALPFTSLAQDMDLDSAPAPTPINSYRVQHQQQHLPQHQPQHQPPPQHPLQRPAQRQQLHHQHPDEHGHVPPRTQTSPFPPPLSGRLSIGSEGRLRTPLPSGRNLERLASAALPVTATLPGIESLSGDLQSRTAYIINNANPHRTRYDAVHVLLLLWSNDTEQAVADAESLVAVFKEQYNYVAQIMYIPAEAKVASPYRWLLQAVANYVGAEEARDTLKILYYAGNSYLDGEREMVLASPVEREASRTIRWSGIQQVLEDASSDMLVLMDAAYYPCSKMMRREGVLELIAASASEAHSMTLGRGSFTRALIGELQTWAEQTFRGPLSSLSAAALHARLMSAYPRIIQDRRLDKEQVTSFPSPLHVQISANARLPSILLAPAGQRTSESPALAIPGTQITLNIRLADGGIDKAGWIEWMRLLPEGVQEVKCESPFRTPFR